jgi:hypothetical protein
MGNGTENLIWDGYNEDEIKDEIQTHYLSIYNRLCQERISIIKLKEDLLKRLKNSNDGEEVRETLDTISAIDTRLSELELELEYYSSFIYPRQPQ